MSAAQYAGLSHLFRLLHRGSRMRGKYTSNHHYNSSKYFPGLDSLGMEMAQLICGGCRTLLMYTCGATSIRCSCCHTVNLAPASSQVAHVNCGNCETALMYPYGAPSVKCAMCQYITYVVVTNLQTNGRGVRIAVSGPHRVSVTSSSTSTSMTMTHIQNQIVVVENPMTVDESGKLVSNVVIGVTKDKK